MEHPDGRAYPWLSTTTNQAISSGVSGQEALQERFLIYQPFAGMCNQYASLESAVCVARVTGRILVLPRWRPQYGWPWLGSTSDYFDTMPLSKLVRFITLEDFASIRQGLKHGEGVALYRIKLAHNPTWTERGFDLYPALKSLLVDLEYFCEIDSAMNAQDSALNLGCGNKGVPNSSISPALEASITLEQPLRGVREIAAHFGDISHSVLALDHAFQVVAPSAFLDAGERANLLAALKPNSRLRGGPRRPFIAKASVAPAFRASMIWLTFLIGSHHAGKLNAFMAERVMRPCLAAHVRRTDHWRLAKLMADDRYWPSIQGFAAQIEDQMAKRELRTWILATDCQDASELAILHGVRGRTDYSELLQGEDGVAAAVLDMWACIGADFFVGTRGSMYTDYIERFRVAGGKVVDHIFFELEASNSASKESDYSDANRTSGTLHTTHGTSATETVAPSLVQVMTQRKQQAEAHRDQRVMALGTAARGGGARGEGARGGAMLGMMAQRLPPEVGMRELRRVHMPFRRLWFLSFSCGSYVQLRAKVLAFHPQAADMPRSICKSPKELFDEFVAHGACPYRLPPVPWLSSVALLMRLAHLLEAETPMLRELPLVVAPKGASENVALLIEPRAHPALEHVIRNAMAFVSGEHGPQPRPQYFHCLLL